MRPRSIRLAIEEKGQTTAFYQQKNCCNFTTKTSDKLTLLIISRPWGHTVVFLYLFSR